MSLRSSSSAGFRSSNRTWALGIALLITAAAPGAILVTPSAASAAACKAVNTTTGQSYGSLQKAINKATSGRTLRITGTCVGNFTVAKNLNLIKGSTAAILLGKGGTTLTVAANTTVNLTRLFITGGQGWFACPEYNGGFACGGGIYNDGVLKLTESTVSGNQVGDPSMGNAQGGGIYNGPRGTLTLLKSTVRDNKAVAVAWAQGGGIRNDGTLKVLSSTISGNSAESSGRAYGGAIANYGSIAGNTPAGRPRVGVVKLDNSTVAFNHATGSTLKGATNSHGGAVFTCGAVHVVSSTVAGNYVLGTPGSGGGGLANKCDVTSIRSSIIANNDAPAGFDCDGTMTTLGDNLVRRGDGCSGISSGVLNDHVGSNASPLEAKLGPLASNGGPTQTRALLPGSPALDAASVPCAKGKDQRGKSRPRGNACDKGAFEL